MLEVGASGRHEHYSRLSPGEEEGKETTQRRGGEDGEREKRQRGKCTNTDNSRTIGFVLVFGLIALRRKTTQHPHGIVTEKKPNEPD